MTISRSFLNALIVPFSQKEFSQARDERPDGQATDDDVMHSIKLTPGGEANAHDSLLLAMIRTTAGPH